MRDFIGSLRLRAAIAACVTLFAISPAAAQQPQGITEAPPTAEFFPRFDFNMSAVKLAYPDQRFSWDTHWAGDFDLFDYVHGRVGFIGDYQALLGSEYRPFDPYQSNYLLEATGSMRSGKTEVLGVLSHVSRHMGDRFKPVAVAENSLGPRVMRRFTYGDKTFEVRGDVRKVIARAYVDYTWLSSADLIVRSDLRPRVGVYGRAFGQTIAVDKTIAGRDRQSGGRLEAGVDLRGAKGDLELFVGTERVVDADQLDRLPRHWTFFGFRLLRN